MNPEKTIVSVGKYKFQIIDNILKSEDTGNIYNRSFKIGGDYADCVSVSIRYNKNQPVYAYIPHAMYDPECSMDVPLERGGSVIMIKTLLDHVHKILLSIDKVEFEDKSNIECATENEVLTKGSRFRKRGTNVIPIPFYYFSIAFNGQTWYEKHFHARQKDPIKHKAYREMVDLVLNSADFKSKMSFDEFLEITGLAQYVDEIKKYYDASDTFGGFFRSIPVSERCRLVRDWIHQFMSYHFKDVFSNSDWIIDISVKPDAAKTPLQLQSASKKGGGKRKTRKYYCPPGRFILRTPHYDMGVLANEL
jgi:hypothetical protein